MIPCHLMGKCHEILNDQNPIDIPLFENQNQNFQVWDDPQYDYKTDLIQDNLYVKRRIMNLYKSHAVHPALLEMSFEQEKVKAWFQDMDPSDIAVESLLLRRFQSDNSVAESDPLKDSMESPNHMDKNSVIENVMRLFSHLCKLDPYMTVFPYRNSNIKSNEEALLLISLNFEAALRSRYTQYLLNLKKKMLSQEIQDAAYHAAHDRLRTQIRELKSTQDMLAQVQNESLQTRERYRKIEEEWTLKNRGLREQLHVVTKEMESLSVLCKEQSVQMESQSLELQSQAHQLALCELQLNLYKKDVEKLEHYEKLTETLTEKIKEEPYSLYPTPEMDMDPLNDFVVEKRNLEQENQMLSQQVESLTREAQRNTESQESLEQELQRANEKIKFLETKMNQNQQVYQESLSVLESKYVMIVKMNQVLKEEWMSVQTMKS